MNQQPREIHLLILSFLNQQALIQLSRVNKYYSYLALDETLWKRKVIQVYESEEDIGYHPLCWFPGKEFDFRNIFVESANVYKHLIDNFCEVKNVNGSVCDICEDQMTIRTCSECHNDTCDSCGYFAEDINEIICEECTSYDQMTCVSCGDFKWYTDMCKICWNLVCKKCQWCYLGKYCGFRHIHINNIIEERIFCGHCSRHCAGCEEQILKEVPENKPTSWFSSHLSLKNICDKCNKHFCDDCRHDHDSICIKATPQR